MKLRRTSRPPYGLLSLLLHYPDAAILAARPSILAAVTALPISSHRDLITCFCRYWARTPATTLAQRYVETLDLEKRSGLYLSYYLYGDTRRRGMALVRLKRMYRADGLVLESGELPDYLPAVLEYADYAPAGHGELVLREYRAALALIQRSLHDMGSPYALLLDAVCLGLPALSREEHVLLQRLLAGEPPVEEVGLAPFAPPEVMPVGGIQR